MDASFVLLLNAEASKLPIPDKSVHCIVTSPPYYGLRSYSGVVPVTYGGDAGCEHEWVSLKRKMQTGGASKKQQSNKGVDGSGWFSLESVCEKCASWRGHLGLESGVSQYVRNMVFIFRELRRVLRDDGIVWLNIGDSYNGSGGAGGDYNKGGLREGQPKYPGRNEPKRYRLRSDLSQDEVVYVLSELAKARTISDDTKEGLE